VSGLESWREEKQSAWLYLELAACEPDSRIADLFRALATAAERQAQTWQPPAVARRPVNRLSAAPTPNNAMPATIAATTIARDSGRPSRNGTSGSTAPAANATKENSAAPQGEPRSSGLRPSSSRASASSAASGFFTSARVMRLASSRSMPRAA
jgi:hypothetical protein